MQFVEIDVDADAPANVDVHPELEARIADRALPVFPVDICMSLTGRIALRGRVSCCSCACSSSNQMQLLVKVQLICSLRHPASDILQSWSPQVTSCRTVQEGEFIDVFLLPFAGLYSALMVSAAFDVLHRTMTRAAHKLTS